MGWVTVNTQQAADNSVDSAERSQEQSPYVPWSSLHALSTTGESQRRRVDFRCEALGGEWNGDDCNRKSTLLQYIYFCFAFNLFFNWRIIALQNFGVFCQTSTWISHESESEVDQSCWTLCHPVDCSLPGSSLHGQKYWSRLPFPSPGDPPNPGTEPGSPTLEADALTSEPRYTYIPSLLKLPPSPSRIPPL